MRPIVNIYKLGRVPYMKTLDIQHLLFNNLKRLVTSTGGCNNVTDNNRQEGGADAKIKSILGKVQDERVADLPLCHFSGSGISNSLLLVEHEPVYTVGLRAQQYDQSYVVKLKSRLAEHNLEADFVYTNRGGLITFHGPGQLVAYPIIYLGDFPKTIPNKSVKEYVKKLEDTIIEALAQAGLGGAHTVREYPGVWVGNGERKVAFVGITCKRYVTMHGISINCDCELSWFDHIVSCGIEDRLITSVRNEFISTEPIAVECNPTQVVGDKRISLTQNGPGALEDNLSHTDISLISRSHSEPRYSVQNIANAFCSSFSRHFGCELREGQDLVSCQL